MVGSLPSVTPYDEAAASFALAALDAQLRTLEPASLLVHVARALNHPAAARLERMRTFAPWTLLTIVERIGLAQREPASTSRLAVDADVHDIVSSFLDFGNTHCLLPSQFDSVWSFARTTAFRQFWLQGGLSGADLSRQYSWFGSVEEFNVALQALVGFRADEFLDVVGMLMSRFIDPSASEVLSARDVDEYGRLLGGDLLERYFKQTSRTLSELAQELPSAYALGTAQPATVEEQVFGQTPLWRFPFTRVGSDLILLGRPLFWAHARDYVFETLRFHRATWLGPRLGPHFERYLEHGLKHARMIYRDEAWLRQVLPGNGKVVDFVVVLGDVVLLVDAKAILLPAVKRRAVTRDDVTKQLSSSVVKAVGQGLEVAERLWRKGVIEGTDFTQKTFFLLAVTPSDLYLSAGEDFIQNYAAAVYAGFSPPRIPQCNFFVASAHEWDAMMSRVADGGVDLAAVLKERAAINVTQKTLQFGQMLFPDEIAAKAPPYLKEPSLALLKRLHDRAAEAEKDASGRS